ncbi:recombinase family protein [Rhodococcus oryzae]|uniref:recombinase family protein n=1 Tax=Rhodococcus oryzae TaxID=2571143 RepID=UPI0037153305
MRAAVYLRQSQDRDGDGYGIDRQREDVERLIAARGWTVHAEYVDNDVSATSRKPRPQFLRMLAAVDAGDVDVIVSRHVDRLLRRLSELEELLSRCEAHNVSIVTAADSVDTSTDGGRLVARILASVGQGEMERKSARQKSAAMQAANQGRWIGGRRAFGFEGDGVTVREAEAGAVRQGYADVLAGLSMAEVARKWNAAGFVTPQGKRDGSPKPWNHSNVKDVLTNPRYCGLRRYRPGNSRVEIRQKPTLGITAAAEWPEVVSEDTWRAAVEILSNPARRRPAIGGKRLLTGVALCGVCGETVHGGAARPGVPAYRCRSGAHVSRKAAPVDQYIEAVAVARLCQPDALEVFSPQMHTDIQPLIAEAEVLRRRRDTVLLELADGVITSSQLRVVLDRIGEQLGGLEAQIAEAGSADLLAPLVNSGDVAAAWEVLEVPRKRAVIDLLMTVRLHTIGRGVRTFRPESVGIEWKSDAS